MMRRFKKIFSLSLLLPLLQACTLSEPENDTVKCHDEAHGLSYILAKTCLQGRCDANSGRFAFNFQSGMCPDGFICGRSGDNYYCKSCDEGLILCDGKCINSDDSKYCGAKGLCYDTKAGSQNYHGKTCGQGTVCEPFKESYDCFCGHTRCDGDCIDGVCLVTCEGDVCEKDGVCENDNHRCGSDCIDCGKNAICNDQGECECQSGFHDYENGCEADSVDNCGEHGRICTDGQQCIGGHCLANTDYTDNMDIRTNIEVGDTIVFGHYEQDNNKSNGKEPIEWRVLDKNSSGQYLIVSEKTLDSKQYNTSGIDIDWEKSTIRSWLNGYGASYNTIGNNYTSNNFIDTAFSAEEKAMIIESNVPADENPEYGTSQGNATMDRIFLLSIVEVNKYFPGDADRKSMATLYAINNGVYAFNSETSSRCDVKNFQLNKCSAWWRLRSPGNATTHYVASVGDNGRVNYGGYYVGIDDVGIRPALWLNY